MEKIRFQIHEKELTLYSAVREERTMSEERYAIIFSSLTGNTRKLADTIHETLPTALCDFFGEAKSAEIDRFPEFARFGSSAVRREWDRGYTWIRT